MNKILVLYPKLFNCYSKFSRKIVKIISKLDNVTIVYPSDPNDFIAKISKQEVSITDTLVCEDWSVNDVTHAIVFDDGEEFDDEVNRLIADGIVVRQIKIAITRVINLKIDTDKNKPNREYIGRGSYWGNPYSMYENGDDREEVIRKFKYDFDYEKFPNKEKSEVHKLAGKRLACFCKPQACHGDVLADFLNSWDDGK